MDPEFIRDLFAQFRPVTVRRMFSGAGIFADGLMFGLVVDGAIHLKVDETNIADFEREGSRPFTYTRGKSSGETTRHALHRIGDCRNGFTTTPMESSRLWAERAFAVAERKNGARKRTMRKPLRRKWVVGFADIPV